MRWLPLILALAFLAGCPEQVAQTLNHDAAPAELAADWVPRSGSGWSIAAPPEWEIPQNEGGGIDANTLRNLENPGASYGLGSAEELTGDAELVLAHSSYRPIPGEPRTQISVSVMDRGSNASLIAEGKKLEGSYASVKTSQKVELPVGPAHEVVAVQGSKTGDTYHHIGYCLVDGTKVYQILFQSNQGMDAIQSVARPVVETFRVTGS